MSRRERVLVTGADQHQGLAVIRGVGRAGFPVVACGAEPRSLGFYSRYATARGAYTAPTESPRHFLDDMWGILDRTRPDLIIPTVESTLVVLNEARPLVERRAPLAAPEPEILEYALDKTRTLALAARLGVPVPRSVQGATAADILERAAGLRFPVAVKPRGHGLHLATANRLGFKVHYARTPDELRRLLAPFAADASALLVQEYVPGAGRCVAALCRHGEPLVLFAYAREREFPLTGGVSVLRRSLPLAVPPVEYATALLREVRWHGVAMVEFKYDVETGAYTLMEINGRFQASTALSLRAGINLPHLLVRLYRGRPVWRTAAYRVGTAERWLRGDLLALRHALLNRRNDGAHPAQRLPSRLAVLRAFLRDFRRGMHYDELAGDDWKPALVELAGLAGMLLGWFAEAVRAVAAYAVRTAGRRVNVPASAPTHLSMRA